MRLTWLSLFVAIPLVLYGVLARVGRMALTNYLMHTVIFVVVFHTLGLLPCDGLDHDAMFLLGLATWAVQIVLSWVWLAGFRQGPVEAMWRRATLRLH